MNKQGRLIDSPAAKDESIKLTVTVWVGIWFTDGEINTLRVFSSKDGVDRWKGEIAQSCWYAEFNEDLSDDDEDFEACPTDLIEAGDRYFQRRDGCNEWFEWHECTEED
jgi:hypothetical protein